MTYTNFRIGSDQTENGSNFRILTSIDEHTRACLATHAAWSIQAVDVITVLEAAIARYGAPEHIRIDNGLGFIAYAIQDWMEKPPSRRSTLLWGVRGNRPQGDRLSAGQPAESAAKPNQNGPIESFHDKLRDGCLNRELFGSLLEARVILESWRVEYNDLRPHSSLGYLSPSEYMRKNQSGGGCAPPNPAPLAFHHDSHTILVFNARHQTLGMSGSC